MPAAIPMNTGHEKGFRMFQSIDGSPPQSSVLGGKAAKPSNKSTRPASHAQSRGVPTSTAANTKYCDSFRINRSRSSLICLVYLITRAAIKRNIFRYSRNPADPIVSSGQTHQNPSRSVTG